MFVEFQRFSDDVTLSVNVNHIISFEPRTAEITTIHVYGGHHGIEVNGTYEDIKALIKQAAVTPV